MDLPTALASLVVTINHDIPAGENMQAVVYSVLSPEFEKGSFPSFDWFASDVPIKHSMIAGSYTVKTFLCHLLEDTDWVYGWDGTFFSVYETRDPNQLNKLCATKSPVVPAAHIPTSITISTERLCVCVRLSDIPTRLCDDGELHFKPQCEH